VVLTGRPAALAAVAMLLVATVAPSWTGVGVSVGVLALLVGVDALRAAPVRNVTLTRQAPAVGRVGEPLTTTLLVTNSGGRPLRAVVRDAWPPSAAADGSPHQVQLAPGRSVRLTTTLRPTRRGRRHAGPVTVRSLGPWRLAGRQASRAVECSVLALAPFTSRRHLPARLARLRELDGRAAARTRGEGTEFDSLRDYVFGDDVRAIDWRATARRGGVVVRTWRPERDRRLLIALDTGRTSAGRVGELPRLDAALDAALLLTALAIAAGDRVDLLAYDSVVRASVTGRTGPPTLTAVVTATADLQPALRETDYVGLLAAAARTGRHDLLVLLTGLDAAPVTRSLLPALAGQTTRAGTHVLLGAVADPLVERMATGRGTLEAVYDAAAAERERAERHRTAARLRAVGVQVVDAVPTRLAPDLADAYLALKSAGRL
jgi:uncharacterized protein (DUF58 family)